MKPQEILEKISGKIKTLKDKSSILQENFWEKISNIMNTSEKWKNLKEKIRKIKEEMIWKIILTSPALIGKRLSFIESSEKVPQENAIFLPTHLSDQDMLLAANSLNQMGREISIVSQSTNFKSENIVSFVTKYMQENAGENHFLPLSNKKIEDTESPRQGSEYRYSIEQTDFQRFIEAVEVWKDLVIAGHRPTFDGNFPENMGIGGLIVAYLTHKSVIPTAVFKNKNWKTGTKFLEPYIPSLLSESEKEELRIWYTQGWEFPKNLKEKLIQEASVLKTIYQNAINQEQ